MTRQGTRGHRREPEGIRQSLLCGGVVQLVRTPYSHPEQQILKEISTAVAARSDVEIAVDGLRMKLSVGSIESQPTGIPLLRIRTPNMQMFSGRVSSRGMCFVPKMNTRMWSGIPRLYYKGFAGEQSACAIR